MMKRLIAGSMLLLAVAVQACGELQSKEAQAGLNTSSKQPKLVIGIVVDQMRNDYLHRFADKYSEGGFKRLLREGFNAKNTHYNYIPTFTGPGHASVYSGTTPATHGIIANSWYDKRNDRRQYCVSDPSVQTVGSESSRGEMSPRNMLASTIGDELKLSYQKQAKVLGISIKDRGAILPAGHMADAAYWYDPTNGNFVSSTYYMEQLPEWMQSFNERKLADEYLSKSWETLLPIEQYVESGEDDMPYETGFKGKEKAVFPYDLPKLKEDNGYGLLKATPGGNSILVDLTKAAIEGEDMGQDRHTDMLALSFSTTDVVGHEFGLNSIELQDIYLRLDRDLEKLLNFLDEKVGKGEYLLFLTADHAAADVPQYLKQQRMPAGYFPRDKMEKDITASMNELYGEGKWIKNISNGQVFLNQELIRQRGLQARVVREGLAALLLNYEGIAQAYTYDDMLRQNYTSGMRAKLQKGFHPKRSGDVLFIYNPSYINEMSIATTHGSGYKYDTHVPLVWYGWGIPNGSTVKYHPITDIAATVSAKLNIKFPNGADGQPIEELF